MNFIKSLVACLFFMTGVLLCTMTITSVVIPIILISIGAWMGGYWVKEEGVQK